MVLKKRTTITSKTVRANSMGITPISKSPALPRRISAPGTCVLPAKTVDIISVLEHSQATRGISVGHIVEAIPITVDSNQSIPDYFLGEVVAVRAIDDQPFCYIHFLNESAKLDDWTPLSNIRKLSPIDIETRLYSLQLESKNFFNLSSFSATASSVHPRLHVKSIRGIQLGNNVVLKAWYPSPYPEMISCPDLYNLDKPSRQ